MVTCWYSGRDPDGVLDVHRRAAKGDAAAIETLVERYQGLARSAALRMSRHWSEADDLMQVANYGLLNAIRRFDADRGVQFSTFAFATISGELKRYRRKTAWAVHVPREVQERALTVDTEVELLTKALGRQPTVREVADATGFDENAVLEVLDVRDLKRPGSLDVTCDDGDATREVPVSDGGFDHVEVGELVRYLLSRLPARERRVIELRFFHHLKQTDIAIELGLSQMHVSRILRTALDRLRALAAFEPASSDTA